MKAKLTGSQRCTCEAVFRHPAAHNLEWHDVRPMLGVVGEVVEEDNGELHVTRSGQDIVLQGTRGKDMASVEELMKIRRFLERTGDWRGQPVGSGTHLLVVLDHREARVYKSDLQGSVPPRIVPDDPHGFDRELRDDPNDADGKRRPERKRFYEAIAKALRGAVTILLFGTGTGEGGAMAHPLAESKRSPGDLDEHIVGSVAIDEKHLPDGELLATAREYHASLAP